MPKIKVTAKNNGGDDQKVYDPLIFEFTYYEGDNCYGNSQAFPSGNNIEMDILKGNGNPATDELINSLESIPVNNGVGEYNTEIHAISNEEFNFIIKTSGYEFCSGSKEYVYQLS